VLDDGVVPEPAGLHGRRVTGKSTKVEERGKELFASGLRRPATCLLEHFSSLVLRDLDRTSRASQNGTGKEKAVYRGSTNRVKVTKIKGKNTVQLVLEFPVFESLIVRTES
jgi:hypothetical protein